MSAPQPVVGSMASVVKNVFGEHRQLRHTHAAMELAVPWNGPDVTCADEVIQAVRDTYQMKLVRVGQQTINKSLHGTVLSRHYAQR